MRLEVRMGGGPLVAERRATNIVLRQGAALVANLFAGTPDTQPINQIRVGFGTEAADTEVTSLTPPPGDVPAEALRSPIAPADFAIITDRPTMIQVVVTSLFRPTVELADVSEAGLVAGDRLYNQVVFDPITLRVGQDISFFWEIDFPFGH
jgi:hypothetical protein